MVEFLLSLFVMFAAPEIAAKATAPKGPPPIERAAPAPPVTTPQAEVTRIAPAD